MSRLEILIFNFVRDTGSVVFARFARTFCRDDSVLDCATATLLNRKRATNTAILDSFCTAAHQTRIIARVSWLWYPSTQIGGHFMKGLLTVAVLVFIFILTAAMAGTSAAQTPATA